MRKLKSKFGYIFVFALIGIFSNHKIQHDLFGFAQAFASGKTGYSPGSQVGVGSFDESKKELHKVYGRTGKEMYCGCDFNRGKVNPESCGFKSEKYKKRSGVYEVEHVVPAENFGRSFSEWRDGSASCKDRKGSFKGRKCASKSSAEFRQMEGDMHNLIPAIGAVNAMRSNKDPEMVSNFSAESFGSCKTKVSSSGVEPRDEIKGLFARKYQYMAWKYPKRFKMGSRTEKLMAAWDKQFPVSKEECEYDKKIKSIQGWNNPFVADKCTK